MSMEATTLEAFVQVLHVRKNHWLTVSSRGCEKGVVRLYDSLNGTVSIDTKCQIAAFIRSEEEELVLQSVDTDPQQNGTDCGLHAIANAYELCAGNDPSTCAWKQNEMRDHLMRCLEAGEVRPFPKRRRQPKAVVQETGVTLHCICRMPEQRGQKMAWCGGCKQWYHQKCVNIPNKVFTRKNSWTCNKCL